MSLNVWSDFYDYILPHLAGGVPSTAEVTGGPQAARPVD